MFTSNIAFKFTYVRKQCDAEKIYEEVCVVLQIGCLQPASNYRTDSRLIRKGKFVIKMHASPSAVPGKGHPFQLSIRLRHRSE